MLSKVGTKLKNIVCIAFVIFIAFSQNTVALGAEQSDSEVVNAKAYEYYYNQLNEQEKAYYKILLENADRMKSGTSKIDITSIATQKQWGALIAKGSWDDTKVSTSIMTAEPAFFYDHPEIFYIDTDRLYNQVTEDETISAYIEPESNRKKYLKTGLNSSKDVDACSLKLEKEVNEIVIQAKKQKTVYEQIRFVHDYLIDHVTYDKTEKRDLVHTAYGALVNHMAVCDGYSDAFKMIMDDLGIPCITVCGDTIKSDTKLHGAKWVKEHKDDESHAWNYVQLNGKWYDVDVTWDDADSPGESAENKYAYFLTGSKNFGHEEVEMSSFGDGGRFLKYPQVSAEDPKERTVDTKVNNIGTQTNSCVSQSGEDTNAEDSGVGYIIIGIIGVTWPILIPVLVFAIIHHRKKKEQLDDEEQ